MQPVAEPRADAMAAHAALVEVRRLSRHFLLRRGWLDRFTGARPDNVVRAVDDVSFDIRPGETFALVGESGCGKSTLAKLMVGLLAPTGGTIAFDGQPVDLGRGAARARGYRPQMIFQDPYASLNPRWRVHDIVAEPAREHRSVPEAGIGEHVAGLLTVVGLVPADGRRYPHEFSGGQRQRISIARALSAQPRFLICDEPTSSLDVSVQAQILNLIKRLQADRGLTCVFISHNLAVVRFMATRVGVLYLGRLVELADARRLFTRPLHPYTRMLLDSVPDLNPRRNRAPVSGEIPGALAPPSGCAFHPRCPWADARCRSEVPERISVEGGEVACHALAEGRLAPHTRHPQEQAGDD